MKLVTVITGRRGAQIIFVYIIKTPIPEFLAIAFPPSFDLPKLPQLPELPKLPTFQLPNIPDLNLFINDLIGALDLPSIKLPDIPVLPSFDLPKLPQLPELPKLPTFQLPNIPDLNISISKLIGALNLPKVQIPAISFPPSIDLPQLPKLPQLPVLPIFALPAWLIGDYTLLLPTIIVTTKVEA